VNLMCYITSEKSNTIYVRPPVLGGVGHLQPS